MSIKNVWYGLILLVVVIPFIILLIWGGMVFHNTLLEKSLYSEKIHQDLMQRSVIQEVTRLATMLENKSDPIAYTLTHKRDEVLLFELLKKVISREPSIHVLLLISPDGKIITGRETYDTGKPSIEALKKHWNGVYGSTEQLSMPLQGKIFVGATKFHSEGVFFRISVPVGNVEQPTAVLLAEIDARIMWRDIKRYISVEETATYVVDDMGRLLIEPEHSQMMVSDDLSDMPLVMAIKEGRQWSLKRNYVNYEGKSVFGSTVNVETLGWHIISEIEQSNILEPIRDLIFKLVSAAVLIVIFFLVLGVSLVQRVVGAIQLISDDFERVERQDFTPSETSSSLKELDSMVNSFNRMVKEISRRQQDLNQAAIVFENTSEGIFITDPEPRIVSINNAFSEITGYKKNEVIGKNPSILQSGRQDAEFYKKMWLSIERDGHWHGEIQNRRKDGDIYTELLSINSFKGKDDNVLQYIGVFTDISNIKETEEKLEYLAHHDPLTDLPNRLLCTMRMEHELQLAKRHERLVAVMFLDLDMFKNINDSLGHVLGDNLLREVTKRLKEHLRDEDTIARQGGDEFVLIMGNLPHRDDVERLAANIVNLFLRPFVIEDHEIFIGASIGVSVFPTDAGDSESLLRNADAAMYKAKEKGRNNYQFYTDDLTRDAYERLSMETYLRRALEKNELVIHYQPQYSLASGKMIAVEALLRWQHPELGLIYPDRFIYIAEETGLIVPMGEWIIEEACTQLRKWQLAGCHPLRMAVNLSARQFWKPGLAKVVNKILEKTGVEACQLDLELTESIIMRDTKITEDTLNEFHNMGVELSIDDFGTGYSSLSYLKRFPITRLKIDRSFVNDIAIEKNGDDMINSIIAMGHCMGLLVLAEGVETEAQLNYLKEHGCDEVQGYYYSKPVPADDLVKLCKDCN